MQTIRGTIEEIPFRNEQNGWTVLVLRTDDAPDEPTTAVGSIAGVGEGVCVTLHGEWTRHAVYGRQFKFTEGAAQLPDSTDGLAQYLGAGFIKGVGPATARNIVARFGEDTLAVLANEPHRLAEVPGIGTARAEVIAASFKEQAGQRAAMMALAALGLTNAQALALYELYGDGCVAVVRENPYRLMEDVEQVGFRVADGIALAMGYEENAPLRLQAGLLYTLAWARGEGHTCLPAAVLLETAGRALGQSQEALEAELHALLLAGKLCAREIDGTDMVFLRWMDSAERVCAAKLVELADAEEVDEGWLTRELAALEQQRGLVLGALQRQAVRTAMSRGVMVVTGGPGTGKTTLIRFILHLMDRLGKKALLCAPTGRAAKRMSEATGAEASTIHRLLEYNGEHFFKDEDEPLAADALIVDETSMVDIALLKALLAAVKPGTRVVFVGDADQLPSVGAGDVLGGMLSSGALPVVRLTDVFRQARESRIVTNAHRINTGDMPLLEFVGDFGFERIERQEDVLSRLTGMLARGKLGDPWSDVQVLTPMKKGVLGVYNINAALQQRLNPPSPEKAELLVGGSILRVGDKVMQTKNDYQLAWKRARGGDGNGVYNGDMGVLMSLDHYTRQAGVLFDDGREAVYDFEQLPELEKAYCVSVHKSQGSEFHTVVLPLAGGPPQLLTRNLLYTAVTRARERVILLGREETIRAMVQNDEERVRYTGFKDALRRSAAFVGAPLADG